MSGAALSLLSLAQWQAYRLLAVCGLEFPLRPVEDLPATARYGRALIPPFVYQTWSSNRLGRTHRRQVEMFRHLNPELSFVFFDDDQMRGYMAREWAGHPIYEVFDNARYPQLAVDVFRYCVIYERGGFYFDISKGLRAPICSLLRDDCTGLVSYERRVTPSDAPGPTCDCQRMPYNIVAQYGFGFAPRHPILSLVLQEIVEGYPRFKGLIIDRPKAAILDFTGPDMFTRAVRRHLAQTHDSRLVQTGVDFDGQAIWSLRGSYVRFFSTPPYKFARRDVIVS